MIQCFVTVLSAVQLQRAVFSAAVRSRTTAMRTINTARFLCELKFKMSFYLVELKRMFKHCRLSSVLCRKYERNIACTRRAQAARYFAIHRCLTAKQLHKMDLVSPCRQCCALVTALAESGTRHALLGQLQRLRLSARPGHVPGPTCGDGD